MHAPPATAASLNPPPDPQGRYPDPVTVALTATATDGYTVDSTYYSIDGGPDLTYSAPFEVFGDGLHTVKYWSVDNFGVYETPKTLNLAIQQPFTDLSLSSADIQFVPVIPDPGEQVSIEAIVRNPGWTELSNVAVYFYDFNILIGQVSIDTLAAGTAETVSVPTTFADSGFRLITVKVDPDDLIAELNENNNEASQVLQVGDPDFSEAVMVVQASAQSACRGEAVSISGRADYDFSQISGTEDYPVQGGSVTVSILDPATYEVLSVYTGSHTNVSGACSQGVVSPEADGTYPVIVSVTDSTITAETQTTLTISGPCEDPGSNPGTGGGIGGGGGDPSNGDPGSEPGVTADLYVYSEDIRFSDPNPDPGETTTLFAFINYNGDDPVFDVPVSLNDIYPVGGVLRTFQIGDTLVDFPNGQTSSPVAVTLPWTNTAEGAHIIQAVIEPPFSQFTGNDKATRLILVGDSSLLYIAKSATFLLDADEDGVISPGDTLRYTLSYENQGASEVTGAFISDDYDESLLEIPTLISNSGAAAGGAITWNLGTLAPGASTSVTYEVDIKPDAEFPSGKSVITNYALLSADGATTAAASSEVEVIVNVAPEVNAGDDVTVDEGDVVTLTATGYDYDGDTLTYAWDLDGDGTFETPGQTASWTAVDGPSEHTIGVQVSDPRGLSAADTATIEVKNVEPTAVFYN